MEYLTSHQRWQKNSQSMKDELHIGDGLHPNKEGGIVMANVVLQNRR